MVWSLYNEDHIFDCYREIDEETSMSDVQVSSVSRIPLLIVCNIRLFQVFCTYSDTFLSLLVFCSKVLDRPPILCSDYFLFYLLIFILMNTIFNVTNIFVLHYTINFRLIFYVFKFYIQN